MIRNHIRLRINEIKLLAAVTAKERKKIRDERYFDERDVLTRIIEAGGRVLLGLKK